MCSSGDSAGSRHAGHRRSRGDAAASQSGDAHGQAAEAKRGKEGVPAVPEVERRCSDSWSPGLRRNLLFQATGKSFVMAALGSEHSTLQLGLPPPAPSAGTRPHCAPKEPRESLSGLVGGGLPPPKAQPPQPRPQPSPFSPAPPTRGSHPAPAARPAP